MNKEFNLQKNPYGFIEVRPKPSIEELKEHYATKYFQEESGLYQNEYTDDEINFFLVQPALAEQTLMTHDITVSSHLIDLGCGEGFFSSYFYHKGWKVSCVDLSDHGLRSQNPHLLNYFYQADVMEFLRTTMGGLGERCLINLSNVLEHVVDPVELLNRIHQIAKDSGSVLRLEVPSDFSPIQDVLVKLNKTDQTWVAPPEHLSYFNRQSLESTLESLDFQIFSLQMDFAIEQFLFADEFNYSRDRSLGRAAHEIRVAVTNYLAGGGLDNYVRYREMSAQLNFGRSLVCYVIPK